MAIKYLNEKDAESLFEPTFIEWSKWKVNEGKYKGCYDATKTQSEIETAKLWAVLSHNSHGQRQAPAPVLREAGLKIDRQWPHQGGPSWTALTDLGSINGILNSWQLVGCRPSELGAVLSLEPATEK